MGATVIWSYVDLFGTESIRKAIFIDEPISIYTHADWTEEERLNAGGMTTSPERMIAAFAGAPTNQQGRPFPCVQKPREIYERAQLVPRTLSPLCNEKVGSRYLFRTTVIAANSRQSPKEKQYACRTCELVQRQGHESESRSGSRDHRKHRQKHWHRCQLHLRSI
jgi:hypothetical protein